MNVSIYTRLSRPHARFPLLETVRLALTKDVVGLLEAVQDQRLRGRLRRQTTE